MNFKSFLVSCVFIAFFFIAIPLSLVLIDRAFGMNPWHNIFLEIIGFVLIIAGVIVDFHCSIMFGRYGKGTPIPIDPPKRFVAQGLYRFVRNPMYLAALAIILGEALIIGVPLLFVFVLASAAGFHFYVVYVEEPKLKNRFGQDYGDYLKRVPRWFPKII